MTAMRSPSLDAELVLQPGGERARQAVDVGVAQRLAERAEGGLVGELRHRRVEHVHHRGVGVGVDLGRDAVLAVGREPGFGIHSKSPLRSSREAEHAAVVSAQTSQCIKAKVSAARKTVSPIISTTGFKPTVISSFSWVFMPMPAIEATSSQRERSLPVLATTSGSQPVLLTTTSNAKPTAKPGSSGGRGPRGLAGLASRHQDREDDHRHQHRHPHQLDHGGDVAGLLRHAVAGTHHLRHVVDRRPEEHAGRTRVEPDRLAIIG